MPHYDRFAAPSSEQNQLAERDGDIDQAAMDEAAAAMREVEVEAVRPEPETPSISSLNAAALEQMTIDELRIIAKELDIPDRGTITDQEVLVAEIRKRL